jgi:8-oxo-dGTP diphosphatase
MTKVNFHDTAYLPTGKLTFSVIAASYHGQWLFVRHRDRVTWEIAGGHIEDGESPVEAARRELCEETGAEEFELNCVATYSVEKDGRMGYGQLFVADVSRLGRIPDVSEIAEVKLSDHLPDNLTYPDIQPHLFRKVKEFIEVKGRI